jgi:hypothetical protein
LHAEKELEKSDWRVPQPSLETSTFQIQVHILRRDALLVTGEVLLLNMRQAVSASTSLVIVSKACVQTVFHLTALQIIKTVLLWLLWNYIFLEIFWDYQEN